MVFSLLPLAALRTDLPPATTRPEPFGEGLSHHLPGIVYSTREGKEASSGGLGFWLLTKSKKVWFRVDDVPYGESFPHGFSYNGQPILHSSEVAAWRTGEHWQGRPVVWGEHVSGDWGRGPKGTNFYLSIWTRWSLRHLAFTHPERFELHYGPSREHAATVGSGRPAT